MSEMLKHRDIFSSEGSVGEVDPSKAPSEREGHRLIYAVISPLTQSELVNGLRERNTDFLKGESLGCVYYAAREDLVQWMGAEVLAHIPFGVGRERGSGLI